MSRLGVSKSIDSKSISEQCNDILQNLALREKRMNKEFSDKMSKELQVLQEIKMLVNEDIVKRAYYSGMKARIEAAIMPLKNGNICVGSGNEELLAIKKSLNLIVYEQRSTEKEFLSKIRWDIGEFLWNRLKKEFCSDTFLNNAYIRYDSEEEK